MRSAISIFGPDRPGIISHVTGALSSLATNIEDASMTLLHGHFAMILVVDTRDVSAQAVETAIRGVESLQDLTITFSHDIDESQYSQERSSRYVFHLTVNDSPGIVARVADVLSSFDANIVDCSTRKNPESELFTMILDADVPEAREDDVVAALDTLAGEFSGDVMFNRIDDIDL